MRIATMLALAATLGILGCASFPRHPYKKVVFQCGEKTLVALFREDGKEGRFRFPDGKEITLPRAVSGSGARYSDGKTTFWTKGDGAFVEVDGKMVYPYCLAEYD